MNRIKRHGLILALLSASGLICCSPTAPKSVKAQKFIAPTPPAMLVSAEQKAEFVMTHFWDNFDFKDTSLISRSDYTEQAFADFVSIAPNAPMSTMEKGVGVLMKKAEIDSAMYSHFVELSEKYLYEPNSPLRNEDVYIAFLRNIISNQSLDTLLKIRPSYQLELALKNRRGEPATDFSYTTTQGKQARLYSAKGDLLMLFFFRPDCPVCKNVKDRIQSNGIDKVVQILFINPDIDTHLEQIYDLRASPTLYLLDKDKTVILKDPSIEQIENYLIHNQPN